MNKTMMNNPWFEREKTAASFPIPMRTDRAYLRTIKTAEPSTLKKSLVHETTLGLSYGQAIGEIRCALVKHDLFILHQSMQVINVQMQASGEDTYLVSCHQVHVISPEHLHKCPFHYSNFHYSSESSQS